MNGTRLHIIQSEFNFAGKFIPASQRPDGTWRKARRVKDGYVPQEEVPLYESKGKQFAKKPDLPVGMCPLVAKAAREKRERQQQKQNKQSGLINLPTNQQQQAASHASSGVSKKDKQRQHTQNSSFAPTVSGGAGGGAGSKKPSAAASRVASLSNGISNLDLSCEEDVQKQLKKLRKKIREIETIEGKLKAGDLKVPEQDQLDKVARKSKILIEIQQLEALEQEAEP